MNKYEGYIFGKVNSLNVSDEDILKWARQDFEAGIMTPDEWGDILGKYYRAKMELESGIMTPDEYTNLYNTLLRANSYGADTKDMKDMIKYRDADVIATEEAYKKFKDDKEKLCEKSKHSIADDLNVCKWPDHYIIRGSLSADIKTLLDACLDPTVSLDEFRNMITAHNTLLEYYRDTSKKEEETTKDVTEETTEATPEKSDEQIISEEMEDDYYTSFCEEVPDETPEETPEKSDEQIISEEMEEDRKKETDALKDTIRMLEFILNEYETAMGTTISDRCRKEGGSH